MDLSKICKNTYLIEERNVYTSKKKTCISYPDEGNRECLRLEENSFWFQHRNRLIIEVAKKYAPKSLFWDIGGGNGYVAKGLQDAGIETVLLEPGESGCFHAQARGVKGIVCSTFEDAGISDEVESAGLFDVLEHVENETEFLSRLKIAQGGILFLTVPAYSWLWSNEDEHAGHFRRYTRRSLEKKLSESGFKILYNTYFFSILPLPIFLIRSLPTFLKLRKKSTVTQSIKEHRPGILSKILNLFWNFEAYRVMKNKTLPMGASILVVAQKI